MSGEFRRWLPYSAAVFALLMLGFVGAWMAGLYAANDYHGLPDPDPWLVLGVFTALCLPAAIAALAFARLFRPTASSMLHGASPVDTDVQRLAHAWLNQRRSR